MPFFIERPRVIHAIQWTGDNLAEVQEWAATNAPWADEFTQDGDVLTLAANDMILNAGDYLTGNWMIPGDQLPVDYQQVPADGYVYTVETAP